MLYEMWKILNQHVRVVIHIASACHRNIDLHVNMTYTYYYVQERIISDINTNELKSNKLN